MALFEFDDEGENDDYEGGFPLDGFLLIGQARHGQIVALPTLSTKDGIVVSAAAIYNADTEEWHAVIESKINDFHLHNSQDDDPFSDVALDRVTGYAFAYSRMMVRIYNKKLDRDEKDGDAVPA